METTRFVRNFVLASVLMGGSVAVQSQNQDRPMLVVAAPGLAGFYSRAVMVVMPKDEGHVGFMINRATRTTVASAFPDDAVAGKVAEPIYLGGPREPQQMYAVVPRDPGEGSRRLFGNVFVTVSGKTVDRILAESPREARYFGGYVAWEKGELEQQVGEGKWLVTEADETVLFHPQPDALWPDLVKRIGKTF
jgi:putative transcriptional regulator